MKTFELFTEANGPVRRYTDPNARASAGERRDAGLRSIQADDPTQSRGYNVSNERTVGSRSTPSELRYGGASSSQYGRGLASLEDERGKPIPPKQLGLNLRRAGMKNPEDETKVRNDLELATNETIPPRVKSMIEAGRKAGEQKIDPRAFFVQVDPGSTTAPYKINQYMNDKLPGLVNPQNESAVSKGLGAMSGNHPTLDLIRYRAEMAGFEADEAKAFAQGLKEGRITNPRLALQALFHDAQGSPRHPESGKLKQDIMRRYVHPFIDQEFEYDQLIGAEEPDQNRMGQLRSALETVGYTFDDEGMINGGRMPEMSIDEIGEKIRSYTWEPDDVHSQMFALPRHYGNTHNDDTLTFFDDINTSIDEGSRTENADVEEPYFGVHKKMEDSFRQLKPQLKKSGLLDVLGPDHPLNSEPGNLIQSHSGEVLQAMDANDINSIHRRQQIIDGIKDAEDAAANPKITDNSVNMMLDELLGQDVSDDPSDMNREYKSFNTRYDISDGGTVEGEMDYDMQRRVTDDAAEVSWWPLIDDKYNNANVTDPESFFDGRRGRTNLIRKAHLANRFLNSAAGKGMSFNDIFADEESRAAFEQFVKKFTAMDAKQNWQENVFPDFDEGQVFKNMPMEGGRGGNVRERMYSRMGFGKVFDRDEGGDDYQYGYKPYSDEGVPAPKLSPMDESTGFSMFNEEMAMDRFQDDVYSVIEDEPGMFVGGFDRDVVQNHIQNAIEYGDIDLRDYSRAEIADLVQNARQEWADENALEELAGVLEKSDVFQGIDDDEVQDEFYDFLTDYAANELSPMDAMDMMRDAEIGELDDTIQDLYNKFLQSRGRTKK